MKKAVNKNKEVSIKKRVYKYMDEHPDVLENETAYTLSKILSNELRCNYNTVHIYVHRWKNEHMSEEKSKRIISDKNSLYKFKIHPNLIELFIPNIEEGMEPHYISFSNKSQLKDLFHTMYYTYITTFEKCYNFKFNLITGENKYGEFVFRDGEYTQCIDDEGLLVFNSKSGILRFYEETAKLFDLQYKMIERPGIRKDI